jgi:protein-disulfide isomerase
MNKLTIPVGKDDHAQGPVDAPVTLVEYGDYECPYCGAAHPAVKAVQASLGNELRFIFHNFALSQIHEHAMQAAEAAEAAGDQGENYFWQMHDRLFENQSRLDLPSLVLFADDMGLDVARFRQEVEAGTHRERIAHDFHGGVRSGVNGTPTFFINGVRHDGGFEEADLLAAIRDALPRRRGKDE